MKKLMILFTLTVLTSCGTAEVRASTGVGIGF